MLTREMRTPFMGCQNSYFSTSNTKEEVEKLDHPR